MISKIIVAVLLFFTGIISNAQSRVVLTIKTGSDDLATRDFQENLKITIIVRGKPDFVLENANQGRNWPNNAIRSVTIRLDESTNIEDIKEIILSRQNVGGMWNSGNTYIADNWNLQKVEATAFIEKDGLKSKYNLIKEEGNPLFRFIYGPEGPASVQGHVKSFAISQPVLISSTNAIGTTITPTRPATPLVITPATENKIDIDLKTSNDNLEMKPFQDNVEIRIIIQNKADAILANANKGQNWPNNSIRRVTIPLPADITVDAIKEIHIYRKPTYGIKYVWELGEKDNWNLQSITAFATVKTNGVKKRFDFEQIVTTRRGTPLYRFTYEPGTTEFEGNVCKRVFTLKTATLPAPVNTDVPAENARLDITIGTGGDDLRGGNDNAEIILSFNNHPGKVTVRNIFNGANLPNFSERKRILEIPNSLALNINDIKEVELRHTGGGGFAADNWHIDKVKISVIKDGQTKVLVDRVDAPIHMFTGETRRKKFTVPPTQ